MSINEVGKTYQRPWGTYQTLALGDGYQVKIITVNPNQRLSLQKHSQRQEHWTVVTGQPTITVGNNTKPYNIGETVFIAIGELHRLENQTTTPAAIVEVQIGAYLGEDDIVRIDDIYGR